MQLQVTRSRDVPSVFNVMILQDWNPDKDKWKGINLKDVEFANTQAWATTPNCDDTINTWGPVCRPASESSLPDLEPITPPPHPSSLPGNCTNCPIFVGDSSPAPRSLSPSPPNPTTRAWTEAIWAQQQSLTPPQGRSPTIHQTVKKPLLESTLPCWHCRKSGHKKLLCPNKHLPRVCKTQGFRLAMARHTCNTRGKQPVLHAQLAHDLAVESIKEIIVNLEVGRSWVSGNKVDFRRHLFDHAFTAVKQML
jgi:hypothetical protein